MEAQDVLRIKAIKDSPLYIVSLYRVILTSVYGNNDITGDNRYRWMDDPNSTKIIIEPAWNEDKEQRNKRPAIYISCDGYGFEEMAIGGNRYGMEPTTGAEIRHTRITFGVSFNCFSSVQYDSSMLAYYTSLILLTAEQPIRHACKINDISAPRVGTTTLHPNDKDTWVTPIMIGISSEVTWFNAEIARQIEDIMFNLKIDNNTVRSIKI
jgi:hypothetical protein